jgi:hypothetical protein
MKDDYLWDGSGEPEPDIEKLEKALGRYRLQSKRPDFRVEKELTIHRGSSWTRYAVAAAVLLMISAGVWLLVSRKADELIATTETPKITPPAVETWSDLKTPKGAHPGSSDPPPIAKRYVSQTGRTERPRTLRPRTLRPRTLRPRTLSPDDILGQTRVGLVVPSEIAVASAPMNPFVDPETSKHLEQAQGLLRSFRNTAENSEFDLSYERTSSRRLLARNILLRRSAEARRNLPVQQLLGSLEPFLIDIAHLPDSAPRDDVRAIKARMEKKEIITELQVNSAPIVSRAF